MNKRKIAKLRRDLEALRARRYNLKHSDLESFATKVWRKRDTTRGKEPQYVSIQFPELHPLSIPGHKRVNPYTADSVMDTFEADLNKWDSWLDEQEENKNDSKRLSKQALRKDRDSGRR